MNKFSNYEAQTERAYYEQQESAAVAEIVSACAKSIFDAHNASTMAELQRTIYKYTDCGPAVSFELCEAACGYEDDALEAPIGLDTPHKSPFVYCGDDRARTIEHPWLVICKIGVSSIVEGSDAEVPVEWIDLVEFADDDKYEGDLPELCIAAVKRFNQLVSDVNDEACALWDEAND